MIQLNPRYEVIFKMNHLSHQTSSLIPLTDECRDDFIKEALYAGLYKQGVSLLGSYEKLPDNEISSDIEAIKAANRGLSSKNLPDAENRGFGIRTSKQMLIQGLGGQYLMISGSSLYIKTLNLDSFYSMPHGLRWNGTIVALRIPYHSASFNYINYIE